MKSNRKYDLLEWVNNQNIRWLYHLVFWIAVLVFYTYFFGYSNVNYKITFSFVIILLPVTIITTYYLNYELIPNYLFKKRYVKFFLYFIYTLIISFYIEMGTVMLIFITIAKLQMEEFYPANTNAILLIAGMYVVVFLGVAIKLVNQYNNNQVVIQKLKKEKVVAELKFLKAQLHPHFLFNTLNNLYALTLEKSDKAANVVLKLSELLDYVLYECNAELVSLEKEIKQIDNYIELEKLRFGIRLDVKFTYDGFLSNMMVPPMLLMTIVENSFKHGVSKSISKSWIQIDLQEQYNQITFMVKNSKHKLKSSESFTSGGVGLRNLENRLKLIYKEHYTFNIEERKDTFAVELIIKTLSKS